MNRRSFMHGILAAGAAPYVVTAAGVLMPVRALAVVERAPVIATIRLRDVGASGAPKVLREISMDGVVWRESPDLVPGDLARVLEECGIRERVTVTIL
jgi:hypothetical protein